MKENKPKKLTEEELKDFKNMLDISKEHLKHYKDALEKRNQTVPENNNKKNSR